ncbi:MAG TPA: hypothetical protein VNO18_14735 [Xanthobacteraceae bacterium]|nr:hypothetical protein [Xanthobacteraceae bacterium]
MALVTSTTGDILTGLGDRPGADMTARLLLALTALYVQRPTHTAEEQQQYIELALRLIDKVDAATRTAVSGILQRHPDAPAEVFGRLGGMQSSPDDNPEDDTHSAREQHYTCHQHFADGDRAPMPAPPDAAPEIRQLTLATSEIGEAFFAASPTERRRLLSLIAPVAGEEIQAAPEGGEHIYRGLDVAALQGRIGEFTREFERLVDIPKSLCERILNDPAGEPMVVAAKATGVPIAILQRILLLINPAVSHSVQRVYDLTDVYHGLDRGAARDLLALWRAQAMPNDPTPEARPAAVDRNPGALRASSVASLRSRFGALTERLQGQAVNARPGPGSAARRGLQSR